MRILRNVVQVLVLVVLLAAGIVCLAVTLTAGRWATFLGALPAWRFDGFWMGVAVCCLAVLCGLLTMPRRPREKFLTFDTEGGAVSLSTDAIADYLRKLAGEFPSVLGLRPRIVPHKHTVDILVELRVKAGPQIHEVCELVQQRVRESLTTGLGITEIRRIEVSVHEIVSEHRPDR